MSPPRLEISGGALLVAALLLYLDRDGVAGAVLAGGLLHEAGHWAAIQALGGRVTLLRLTSAGAEMRLSAVRALPPGRMVLAALAGPAANLLSALIAAALARRGAGERLYLFAGLSLGLAGFNLLPAGRLDGGRLLESLFAALGREELGRRAVEVLSAVTEGALLLCGVALLWQSEGRNFTVLAAGLWLSAAGRRDRRG